MKIEHVALYCLQLEEMRAFFVRYFDATSNAQYHNPRTGLRTYILSFPDGGARLEIMQHPDMQKYDPSVRAIGYTHLSISVGSKEQVDAKSQHLQEAGFAVVSGPRTTGDGYYESCVLGPENIQIEITI